MVLGSGVQVAACFGINVVRGKSQLKSSLTQGGGWWVVGACKAQHDEN